MEEIISIHSIVHKKKKNKSKINKSLSLVQPTSKISKKLNSHSLNKSKIIERMSSDISKDINLNSRNNLSQKKNKNIKFFRKYNFEEQNEPEIFSENNNIKGLNENNLKKEEESNTPVMNLQKNKKPNYLRKSALIKDKSLTPQEKAFQNSICPIYDFYKGNSGFNTTKNEDLLKNASFSKYYDNFKNSNILTENTQINDYYNLSPSPLTNLSDKNNMNYYYNFSFLAKNQDKINEIKEVSHDKSPSFNDDENNNNLINIVKDENYNDEKNEFQNIEGSTPSNLGGTISPSFDFFDESIFGNDSNFIKSPINYKQMNVNININNNSQNNNIYYQLPNLINNFNNFNNNTNNNHFNNNSDNNENNYIYEKADYRKNENLKGILNQNNNGINPDNMNNINNNTILNQQNFENINNEDNKEINNIYNNNIKLNNLSNNNNMNNHSNIINNLNDFNGGFNNQANIINQIRNQNSNSNKNVKLNQNQSNYRLNQFYQLNQLSKENQNIVNYLNHYYGNNLNNININNMASNNFNNNNNINNNINYNNINNKNINNKNISFSSIANAYMNQNLLNQNIINNNNKRNINHLLQIQMGNNNNSFNNQPFQYFNYNNQEQMMLQNNNDQNLINNLFNYNNNYPYNNNNINNYDLNINNQINNNIIRNNYSSESIFYSLSPSQLAQQCHIIAKNQNGCRYLQNIIITNPEILKNLFFPKILEHIEDLSNDQFANYFIKKTFQYLSEEMILELIHSLIPIIEKIGTNQYGTKVLQDLIDFLKTEKTFLSFVNIIIPHVKLLIIDLNGSHIIYKLILTKNKNVKIIENIICMNVKDIAMTRKGCSFLKKYFDFANENDLINIKQNILENLTEIITDQYGNYVIQNILTKEGSPIVKDFINEINKNIIFFSNNKFSSNAVEKCFENESLKNIVLDQFLEKNIFEKIILDKFGNYVVQKALAKADNNRRNKMLQLLIPLLPILKTQYYGQRLLSKLMLQYPNLNIN